MKVIYCIMILLWPFASVWQTNKAIFYHFQNDIFKECNCVNQHFGKLNQVLLQQYRIAPLFLHLKQWHFANEVESLIEVQYATKPRNPE